MRILHITQYCHLESVGGTERYIVDLIGRLNVRQHINAVGWLCSDAHRLASTMGEGVYLLPGTQMRVDRPNHLLLRAINDVVERFRPDILHFHTFGRSEAAIAEYANSMGLPYAFTYHSPAWTCRREDLLLYGGLTPCDGQVRTFRCSACKLHERLKYLPVWLIYIIVLLISPISNVLFKFKTSKLRRRISFVADTSAFRKDLNCFLENCSCVFACAEWSVPVLVRNGADNGRLHLCPQGVSTILTNYPPRERPPDRPFTIGYVGRVVPVKGVDILVQGFRLLSEKSAELRIYGWPETFEMTKFYKEINHAADIDSRIKLIPRLGMDEMISEYRKIDLLCIPSVWLETGPLVLFEALQSGVPVFGSDRVGQLNLLKERGAVIAPNTSRQWFQALQAAAEKYHSDGWGHEVLRAYGSESLRDMDNVAEDVVAGYMNATSS